MDPLVTVVQGTIRGRRDGKIRSFLGVPYAQSPFGTRRFTAPEAVEPWAGIRDAIAYGATAPKPGYAPPTDELLPEPSVAGDDCLNLNVWTPEGADHLPVIVWIHGGAFINGSGAVSLYDGTAFARDGIVCVTVNYRLGVEGFGLVDGAVPNRGLLDQIAALNWVQGNIAAFGGDPGRVTVAGESAGAMSVGTLLATPRAEGLFRRAILQSGAGHHVLTPATASKVIAAVAATLGVEPTVAGLGSVQPDEMVNAQTAVSASIQMNPDPVRWGEITVNSMPFEPVIDGNLLPERPIDAIVDGASSTIDVLIGTNTDEHSLFLVPTGVAAAIDERTLRVVLTAFSADVDALVDGYRTDRPDASAGELMVAILTDWFFRVPAIRLAEARMSAGADTHVYEFAWRSPELGGRLGACHALEIGFTFDNLDDPAGRPLLGANPPQALATTMHAAWVAFVRDGNPGWAPYGADRSVMRFDVVSSVETASTRPCCRRMRHGG